MYPFSSNRLIQRSPTAGRSKTAGGEEDEWRKSNIFATLKTSTNEDILEDIVNEDNGDSEDSSRKYAKDSDEDSDNEYRSVHEKTYYQLLEQGNNSKTNSIFAMKRGNGQGSANGRLLLGTTSPDDDDDN